MTDEQLVVRPAEAARVVRLSTKTLANMRAKGGGPVFVRLGRGKRSRIAYRPSDLEAWILECRRASTSAVAPPIH
jgi:hypothetical protein